MRVRTFLVGLMAVAAMAVGVPAAQADSSLALPPQGANNWSCKPTAAHPNPVVLVHGLSATMFENWSYFSPELVKQGYCVFALTYGLDPRTGPLKETGVGNPGGVIPMEQSAAELAVFVDRVLKTTKAKKVDLVGHSEGTIMPQYWLKHMGGAKKVDKYVALTPIYGGTHVIVVGTAAEYGQPYGISDPAKNLVGQSCGSCPQFLTGSDYIKKINEGGPAAKGVTYTTVMTKYDELVTPYTTGYMPGAAHNYVMQDLCPMDPSEHLGPAFDPLALQITFNALDPKHAQPLSCNRLPYAPDHPLVTPVSETPAAPPIPNPTTVDETVRQTGDPVVGLVGSLLKK